MSIWRVLVNGCDDFVAFELAFEEYLSIESYYSADCR